MPDREKVIKEFELFIRGFHPACTSEGVELDMFREVLAMLKEQEADMIALKNAYKELAGKGSVIVRCKNCKKRYTVLCIQEEAGNINNQDDWFCADGVAKDINVPNKEGR